MKRKTFDFALPLGDNGRDGIEAHEKGRADNTAEFDKIKVPNIISASHLPCQEKIAGNLRVASALRDYLASHRPRKARLRGYG